MSYLLKAFKLFLFNILESVWTSQVPESVRVYKSKVFRVVHLFSLQCSGSCSLDKAINISSIVVLVKRSVTSIQWYWITYNLCWETILMTTNSMNLFLLMTRNTIWISSDLKHISCQLRRLSHVCGFDWMLLNYCYNVPSTN